MANRFTALINRMKTFIGSVAGADYTFTIGRPPYINGDNTEVIVGYSTFHVEPAGPNWTEDRIPDVEYFEVCGDPSLFQLGDVLSGAPQIPRVTVSSKADGQEILAIKTDKPCRLEDYTQDFSATNLWFDYMNSTSAGPDEFRQEPDSLNVPVRRVVMFNLDDVTEGMKFHDEQSGWIWTIAKVDRKSFIMNLFLEEPNRA